MRLASRIHDLRKVGFSIDSVTVKRGDKSFSKYFLKEK
ncbi:UNVERIFIED_CONTAM: helix-turn-helix domain [Bacteriophage sp.]